MLGIIVKSLLCIEAFRHQKQISQKHTEGSLEFFIWNSNYEEGEKTLKWIWYPQTLMNMHEHSTRANEQRNTSYVISDPLSCKIPTPIVPYWRRLWLQARNFRYPKRIYCEILTTPYMKPRTFGHSTRRAITAQYGRIGLYLLIWKFYRP